MPTYEDEIISRCRPDAEPDADPDADPDAVPDADPDLDQDQMQIRMQARYADTCPDALVLRLDPDAINTTQGIATGVHLMTIAYHVQTDRWGLCIILNVQNLSSPLTGRDRLTDGRKHTLR